jgi:hypothetical protein
VRCTEPTTLRFAGRIFSKEDVVLYNITLLTGVRMIKLKLVSLRHEVVQLHFMKFTNRFFPTPNRTESTSISRYSVSVMVVPRKKYQIFDVVHVEVTGLNKF